MTGSTPLESALLAWKRDKTTDDRQGQVDDAVALAEWRVFSNAHIAAITDLPRDFVYELIPKSDKTGGRFNPQALDDIWELHQDWARGGRNTRLCRRIVDAGTSQSFLAKLTGISQSTISRWMEETESVNAR